MPEEAELLAQDGCLERGAGHGEGKCGGCGVAGEPRRRAATGVRFGSPDGFLRRDGVKLNVGDLSASSVTGE